MAGAYARVAADSAREEISTLSLIWSGSAKLGTVARPNVVQDHCCRLRFRLSRPWRVHHILLQVGTCFVGWRTALVCINMLIARLRCKRMGGLDPTTCNRLTSSDLYALSDSFGHPLSRYSFSCKIGCLKHAFCPDWCAPLFTLQHVEYVCIRLSV